MIAVATVAIVLLLRNNTPTHAPSSHAPPSHAARTEGVAPSSQTQQSRSIDAAPGDCAIQLRDVTATSGIDFRQTDGSGGKRYIAEAMTGGIATFDYDGDGLIDIYFTNGAPLPGTEGNDTTGHALYRNLGGWRFVDVTKEAQASCRAFGMGVTVGDYDSDGWPDLYLSNYGVNILRRNNGDGTFTEVAIDDAASAARGQMGKGLVGAGTCFLDIEGDGDLDLYVSNYLFLDCSTHVPRVVDRIPSYPSPQDYAPVPDVLYRNEANGTFTDVSAQAGILAHPGRGMGVTCADYDGDGDTDIFVCNDVQENFLFQNDGKGRFEQVSALACVACSGLGEVLANMGVDAGDFDNDGELDFFTTNYQGQLPVLFRNLGRGLFEDVTARTRAGTGCLPHVNWGCRLADLDNDGNRDLFIGNGHTEDNIELRGSAATYKAPCVVLRNLGGTFVPVPPQCGDGLQRELVARGVAMDDLDNDGDLDGVVLALREKPLVLRNMLVETGSPSHWLQVQLRGVRSNRDGIGARVRVKSGEHTWIDEVHSGRGYQSHCGSRLHFGLGSQDRIDRLEIDWIGGGTEVLKDLGSDRVVTVVEDCPPSVPK